MKMLTSTSTAPSPAPPLPRVEVAREIVYRHCNETGRELYQVVRVERPGQPKKIFVRHSDGNGGHKPGRGDSPPCLYAPREFYAQPVAGVVHFVEGQKCADVMNARDLLSVTSGGFGSWRSEFAEYFAGRHVLVWADADAAGEKFAQQVSASLCPVAQSVRLLRFESKTAGYDVADHFASGGSISGLLEIAKKTPLWAPPAAKPRERKSQEKLISAFDCAEFLQQQFSEREDFLVGTLAPAGGATLLFGLPKGLKSWVALGVALDASCGRAALGMFAVARPVRTMLVQVEDRPAELQKRLALLIAAQDNQGPAPGMLRVVPRCPLNLLDPEWRLELEATVAERKPELLILDVLRRLFRGDVSSAQDTSTFLEIVDRIRDAYGCAVLIVHHSKKTRIGEMQTHALGSTNLAAWADVLVQVKSKEASGQATQVEMEIEAKSESTPEPITVVLDPNGSPMLYARPGSGGNDLERARQGLGPEWTAADLARVLGASEPTASRRIEKWSASGGVEKVATRSRGLAVYRFSVGGGENESL